MVIFKEKKAIKESTFIKNISAGDLFNSLSDISNNLPIFRGYSIVCAGYATTYTLGKFSIRSCKNYSFSVADGSTYAEIVFQNIKEVRLFDDAVNLIMKNGMIVDLLLESNRALNYFN